jgi:hypothetical protein
MTNYNFSLNDLKGEDLIDNSPRVIYEPPAVDCPKHGVHVYTIQSAIPGHEGRWCQICWLDSLGSPLPVVRDERYLP